jgi:Icc-related predicted phosphoesterase
MKILAVGDIHGDCNFAKEVSDKAKTNNVDYVLICGDIVGHNEKFENILGHFAKNNQKTIIIPGNHESFATTDFLAELYQMKNLHGYYMKSKNVGIIGCGGANIGLEALSEQEIFETLKKSFEKISELDKKIMITHVHPKGSKMEFFSNFVPGSSGVKKAIDELKPDYLFCSHVHEAQGLEEEIGNTKVINVSRNPKIIEF